MIETVRNPGIVDSIQLAEFVLATRGAMSHLKLQKLLFYIQAYHLGHFGIPIIEDDFEAWIHGPVSRKLYDLLKDQSKLYTEIRYAPNGEGPPPQEVLEHSLTNDQNILVIDVLDELAPLSDFELENMTHSEAPWQEARHGYGVVDRCNVIIPKQRLAEYYSELLHG